MEQGKLMTDVPRRLSVDDEDYDPAVGARVVVLLDGIDQCGRCTGYDIDAGAVTRAKHDASGNAYVEDGEFAVETVQGVVEVHWRREV